MYINGVFLHQFQPWFLIIAPLNLPLKWAIPIVQSHLWAMNHSPSVAPPKSFPGIARFDDTRPDTAWAWAQRNSETKRCSRQWRQIGQNKTRIYRFTYSYRSIHLYIYRYHIYIHINHIHVYIYILCVYIYICVCTHIWNLYTPSRISTGRIAASASKSCSYFVTSSGWSWGRLLLFYSCYV